MVSPFSLRATFRRDIDDRIASSVHNSVWEYCCRCHWHFIIIVNFYSFVYLFMYLCSFYFMNSIRSKNEFCFFIIILFGRGNKFCSALIPAVPYSDEQRTRRTSLKLGYRSCRSGNDLHVPNELSRDNFLDFGRQAERSFNLNFTNRHTLNVASKRNVMLFRKMQ